MLSQWGHSGAIPASPSVQAQSHCPCGEAIPGLSWCNHSSEVIPGQFQCHHPSETIPGLCCCHHPSEAIPVPLFQKAISVLSQGSQSQ